jgi:hypothetical protein
MQVNAATLDEFVSLLEHRLGKDRLGAAQASRME